MWASESVSEKLIKSRELVVRIWLAEFAFWSVRKPAVKVEKSIQVLYVGFSSTVLSMRVAVGTLTSSVCDQLSADSLSCSSCSFSPLQLLALALLPASSTAPSQRVLEHWTPSSKNMSTAWIFTDL